MSAIIRQSFSASLLNLRTDPPRSILSTQEVCDQEDYEHAHAGGDAYKWRVVLACFRQQVRRADIEKRTGEECEHDRQQTRSQIEHQRRGRTDDRRRHVDYQPEDRVLARIAMRKNDSHRVQSVTEIMRDNAQGNQKAHLAAHLKADANRHSVKETVKGEARCRHRAKFCFVSLRQMRVFARAMHCGVSLKSKEGEESECGDRHVRCAVVECENVGQDVEQSDGQDGARTETEQQMKPVAQADSGGPAQPGGEESYQGKKN